MSKRKQLYRIYISRTESQWETIDKRLQELGRSDLKSYIRGRVSLLTSRFEECPESVCSSLGEKVQKQYYLEEQYFKMLEKISLKTGIPESTIVDRLVIDYLISPKP